MKNTSRLTGVLSTVGVNWNPVRAVSLDNSGMPGLSGLPLCTTGCDLPVDRRRNVGKQLLAGLGIESMQHAVVGAHIQGRGPLLVLVDELLIRLGILGSIGCSATGTLGRKFVPVSVVGIGDVQWLGPDDGTHDRCRGCASCTPSSVRSPRNQSTRFEPRPSLAIVDELHVDGRAGIERALLAGAQVVPCKRNAVALAHGGTGQYDAIGGLARLGDLGSTGLATAAGEKAVGIPEFGTPLGLDLDDASRNRILDRVENSLCAFTDPFQLVLLNKPV